MPLTFFFFLCSRLSLCFITVSVLMCPCMKLSSHLSASCICPASWTQTDFFLRSQELLHVGRPRVTMQCMWLSIKIAQAIGPVFMSQLFSVAVAVLELFRYRYQYRIFLRYCLKCEYMHITEHHKHVQCYAAFVNGRRWKVEMENALRLRLGTAKVNKDTNQSHSIPDRSV